MEHLENESPRITLAEDQPAELLPRDKWQHPELPRFYVCAGLHRLAGIVDQASNLDRVTVEGSADLLEFDSWGGAALYCTQLNQDAEKHVLRFAAFGASVLKGDTRVAKCISKTYAKRIANALNHHKPNSEGV